MINKTFFPYFIHYSIYFISAFLFSKSLDISMLDDGLRHISFAKNIEIMKNWGEVFPNSLFNEYDPWFLWHKLISILSLVFEYSVLHIVINTIVLFLFMSLLDLFIRKYIRYNFDSLIYIVVFILAYLTSSRYLIVRPDLLSGLYILYALLLSKRFLPIFLLTFIYGPFYYLFFIYTGSIALVYLIQKKVKVFWGVLFASICSLCFHLLLDAENYIYTVKNILLDQRLRMGLEVGEGKALFKIFSNLDYFILLPLFTIICIILIYKNYSYFRKNQLALFLLITSILWINQIRYYLLFFPLISIYILSIILKVNVKNFFQKVRKFLIFFKKYFNYSKKVKLFYIIAIPYTIFALSYAFNGRSVNKKVEEAKFFKNETFNNKIILLNRLHIDMYKAIYNNPTLKFIPSCSVGWFENKDKRMKDIYIRMQKSKGINEFELKELIDYVNADYYIHYTQNDKQILNFDKLRKFDIIPEMIYHNRIIFKIKKTQNE